MACLIAVSIAPQQEVSVPVALDFFTVSLRDEKNISEIGQQYRIIMQKNYKMNLGNQDINSS